MNDFGERGWCATPAVSISQGADAAAHLAHQPVLSQAGRDAGPGRAGLLHEQEGREYFVEAFGQEGGSARRTRPGSAVRRGDSGPGTTAERRVRVRVWPKRVRFPQGGGLNRTGRMASSRLAPPDRVDPRDSAGRPDHRGELGSAGGPPHASSWRWRLRNRRSLSAGRRKHRGGRSRGLGRTVGDGSERRRAREWKDRPARVGADHDRPAPRRRGVGRRRIKAIGSATGSQQPIRVRRQETGVGRVGTPSRQQAAVAEQRRLRRRVARC